MFVDNYKIVALIYDHLMTEIDYKGWTLYINEIKKKNKIKNGLTLEIACGSGKIAELLQNSVEHLYVGDKSFSMLKNIKSETIPKICFDMTMFPFKHQFSFIYSTFDSINYILEKKQLKKFFASIDKILAPKGCFTFDVSLENNSYRVIEELNREGVYQGFYYRQQSSYNKRKKIHENNFLVISPEGEHYEEIHLQKIYKFYDYFSVLENTNLYVSNCYNAFTFEDADPSDERAQFVIRKR